MFHIISYTTDTNHIQKYKLYHGVRQVVRIPKTEGKILQWSNTRNNNNNNADKFKEEFEFIVIELR